MTPAPGDAGWSAGPRVLVGLDVLVRPREEDRVARAVRAAVASAAPVATLGPVAWSDAVDGADLVDQWGTEQRGAPLDGRRVRSLTMTVDGDRVSDRLDDIAGAAIDAISPTAREEERRLDAGETPVPATPDRYPWSSWTHVVEPGGAHDRPR